MATVNFLVKGKDNPATIYLRFKHGRSHDYTKSTNKLINPKNWHPKNKMPYLRDGDLRNLSTSLQDLANDLVKAFNQENIDNIDGNWVQLQIDIFNKVYKASEKSDLVTDCISNVIKTAFSRENAHKKRGISKSRINSYKNLLKIFTTYQGKKRKKYRVKDVDVNFSEEFLNWMIDVEHYSLGHAKKKIDDLKTVCMDAESNGVQTNPQLKKIKGGRVENNYIIYLSPEELEKIKKIDIESPSLANVRKWLLLGCNIGQRGGDLLNLSQDNFITKNGLELIELKQQKTGKRVAIPVLPTTKEILKEGLPYKIATQKFNEKLKILCKQAGIDQLTKGAKAVMLDSEGKEIKKDENGKYPTKGIARKITRTFPKYELITSHVCRRSFATNQYGILPTPLIMQITAHSTEKMLQQYIGKPSYDYAKQISDFYARQAELEQQSIIKEKK